MLGEEGTEQFEITTRVNGQEIGRKPVHDPFHRTRVVMRGWRHAWNALTKGIEVQVSLDGTEGAQRAIMTMDPCELQRETVLILTQRAMSRENNGSVGYYAETTQSRKGE